MITYLQYFLIITYANVAREHGPELLKALKALVKAAERTGTLRTDSGALGRAIHLLSVTGDYQ